MKLVILPGPEGGEIALNTEMIVALVPADGQTDVNLLSGDTLRVAMAMPALIERLTSQGWRKN